jgi:hypothetical protein
MKIKACAPRNALGNTFHSAHNSVYIVTVSRKSSVWRKKNTKFSKKRKAMAMQSMERTLTAFLDVQGILFLEFLVHRTRLNDSTVAQHCGS